MIIIEIKDKGNNNQMQQVAGSNSTSSLIGGGGGGQHPFNSPSPSAQTTGSSRPSQEQLADKYSRKYNLISFILLRKNDEYLVNEKFYINDQYNYERVDDMIDRLDLVSLMTLFSTPIDDNNNNTGNKNTGRRLADYVNSYNSSIFVYTIRKLVEKWASLSRKNNNRMGIVGNGGGAATNGSENLRNVSKKNLKQRQAIVSCIKFMFSRDIRPSSYFLIDGDYPRRNIMHYAAR